MPARHLVGGETQPLSRYSMLKVDGKKTIVAADEDFRSNSRPAVERPRFPKGRPGLRLNPFQRGTRQLVGDVVEEDLNGLFFRLRRATCPRGVDPPLPGDSPGAGIMPLTSSSRSASTRSQPTVP
jgi:hypothetical protein